ncbi:hypothetical protein CSW77_26545, partial [Shigella flexneri]
SADGTTTLGSTGSDAEPAAEHELRSVTRPLGADQAIATGAKPWQRRRLETLMQEAPNSDFGEGARLSFDLTISADGTTTLGSTGSDAEPAAEHELRSVTRPLGAD